jgi:hypothetical protein
MLSYDGMTDGRRCQARKNREKQLPGNCCHAILKPKGIRLTGIPCMKTPKLSGKLRKTYRQGASGTGQI